MKNRYDGTFTVTLSEGLGPETFCNCLDAGTRAVLGAIWREYEGYASLNPSSLPKMRIAVEISREAMANLVVGCEHIHTDACLFDQDCPVFRAGYEEAQDKVREWADPDLLR